MVLDTIAGQLLDPLLADLGTRTDVRVLGVLDPSGQCLGAAIADRVGGRRMLMWTMPLATPLAAGFLLVDGPSGTVIGEGAASTWESATATPTWRARLLELFADELPDGPHTLTLRIVDRPASPKTRGGTAARILAFAVNGK